MRLQLPIRVWLWILALALWLWWPAQPRLLAQTVSDYQVKAAYVYNFSKFVEWPDRDFANATAPIRLCVLNDRLFESALDQIVKGKVVAGRQLSVVSVATGEEARNCHILVISSSQQRQVRNVIKLLGTSSVLTVGESSDFVQLGGIINFVSQDDRVQFQVNHKAATQVGLQISSRLLGVAKAVIE